MNKKKILIITSSILGALVLGAIVYRFASRYNKEIIEDGNTTILISKDEPTDVEVVEASAEDANGSEKVLTQSMDSDLMEYEIQSGMGDY